MTHLCGCYYYVLPKEYRIRTKQYLPLLDSEAHTTILSTTSRTVLKQNFTNSSNEAIQECTYIFPLYDGVSIVSFTCRTGSKIIRGLVKERVEAREIFDSAVARGETAGLLEQAVEASDVFSTKIGNIPAGESVVVQITYLGELKHHETEGIRFTIPTSIAPRYGCGPFEILQQGSIPIQDNGGIKVTVDVSMPDGSFIKGVQSPSHPIAVSMGIVSTSADSEPVMSKASATLSLGSTALEKDFVLIIQVKDIGIPTATLESHPTIPNHRALMVTLVPKFSLPPSRPEIIFVADRSGSMGGNIAMLISAMKVFLKSLPVKVKFNICSFGSSSSFLWPHSRGYDQETLREATSHVEAFGANMGGTETFEAIRATVERRFTDLPLEIILLTDGDIWQQNELFSYLKDQVKKTGGKVRVFTLGIGDGVSHALIEGLARAGNGFAQTVQQGERLDNCVVRMLRGALSPHITDYTLEVKYDQEDDDFELIERVSEGMRVLLSNVDETEATLQPEPKQQATISLFDPSANLDFDMIPDPENLPTIPYPKLLQSPHKIPSLYSFSRTTVYLLMSPETIQRNPTSVVIRATSAHGPLALEIPVEILSTPAETIHQLAAKKAVQDLEEGRGWIFDAKDQDGALIKDRFPSRFDDLVKKEAVRLGRQFQIAGRWCSFVAVAANDEEMAATSPRDGEEETESEIWSPQAPARAREGESLGIGEAWYYMSGGPLNNMPRAKRRCRAAVPLTSMAAHSSPASSVRKTMKVRRSSNEPSPLKLELLASQNLKLSGFGPCSGGSPKFRRAYNRYPATSPPVIPLEGASKEKMQTVNDCKITRESRADFCERSEMRPASFTFDLLHVPDQNDEDLRSEVREFTVDDLNSSSDEMPEEGIADTWLFASEGPLNSMPSDDDVTYCGVTENFTADFEMGISMPKPAAVNWRSKTVAEKVLGLVALQNFEGWWPEDGKEVEEIMGFEIPEGPVANRRAWVTMLVVCFLEQRMESQQGTWDLVVEKARAWLVCNHEEKIQNGSLIEYLQDLEKAATELLKGI